MGKYEAIIEILADNDYYRAKKLINLLGDKDSFVDVLIHVSNPHVYDRFTKMYEYKMYTSFYNEARNKIIKKVLLRQTDDKKLDYFRDVNKSNFHRYLFTNEEKRLINESPRIKEPLETISNRWLNEYIVFYFFQDNYYNFMINLFQMVSYLGSVKLNLVDRNHIDLYNEFRGLNNMSFKDKIEFFKKHVNNNYIDMFYDDMRIVKDNSYKELVNSAIKLNHDSDIYCKDISRSEGIDIYFLNGEKFYAFVKCFDISRDDLTDHEDYIYSKDNRLGYSFSYIGDKNIGTVDYEQKGVILLYDDIDYNKIMYVHHGDLHAKRMDKQNDYLSEKENEIITPSSLIAHTKNYNEIYIVDRPKPRALVCYDNITKDDILFAKKYNLSLVLINREKYKRYETYDDDYINDTYSL